MRTRQQNTRKKKNLEAQTYLHSLVLERCESVGVNADLVIRFRG